MSARASTRRASFRSLESANRAIALERAFTDDLRRMYERRLIEERARMLDVLDALTAARDFLVRRQVEGSGDVLVKAVAAIKKAEAR